MVVCSLVLVVVGGGGVLAVLIVCYLVVFVVGGMLFDVVRCVFVAPCPV